MKLILDGYNPCNDPLDQVFNLLCDNNLPSSFLRHALQESQSLLPEDCYKSIAADIDELEEIMKTLENSDDEDEAVGSTMLSIQRALSSLTTNWRIKFESIAKTMENLESGISHYRAQVRNCIILHRVCTLSFSLSLQRSSSLPTSNNHGNKKN